jgi:hypothetical protein
VPDGLSPIRRRSAAAKRQARCRKRRRSGLVVLKIEVPEVETIEALLKTARLSEAAALDKAHVEQAVGELVADFAEEWKRRVTL